MFMIRKEVCSLLLFWKRAVALEADWLHVGCESDMTSAVLYCIGNNRIYNLSIGFRPPNFE